MVSKLITTTRLLSAHNALSRKAIMITAVTATERAIDPARPLRLQRVRLHTTDGRDASLLDIKYPTSCWQDAFLSSLGTTNFDGKVDWLYSVGDGMYCLALHSLNHPDIAVQILTTLVLECNKVIGWYDLYEQTYGETMAATLCRDCILVDNDFRSDIADDSKIGWTLAFTNIDTTAIAGVVQQLPTTVEQWLHPTPAQVVVL